MSVECFGISVGHPAMRQTKACGDAMPGEAEERKYTPVESSLLSTSKAIRFATSPAEVGASNGTPGMD